MAANPPEHSLHGGPRRIVELAARALGFAAGQATLLEDDGRQVVVTVGPVAEEDDRVRWRIPFCHHPPYCAGPRHHNTRDMQPLVRRFRDQQGRRWKVTPPGDRHGL